MQNKVINNYAKALFDISNKANDLVETSKRLNVISSMVNSSTEFRLFLYSRRIELSMKKLILNKVFISVLTSLEIDLLNSLMEDGNINLICQVVKQFDLLFKNNNSDVKITVSIARELHKEELSKMVDNIEKQINKKIKLDVKIAPEILGGIKFRIGNKIIDGSIYTRLKRLENSLFQG